MFNAPLTKIVHSPRTMANLPAKADSGAGSDFSNALSRAISAGPAPTSLSTESPLVYSSTLGFVGMPLSPSLSRTTPKFDINLPSPYGTGATPAPYTGPGKGEPLSEDPLSSYSGTRFSRELDLSDPVYVGGDIDQFHFPHITEKDGLYYAYFIDHSGGSENDVGLATSEDAVNWEYQGKVLTKGDDFDALQASFPAVQYDGDTETWYMLYEAKSAEDDVNSVSLATSKDGKNWRKQGPIISPGASGEISNIDVGTPTMFKEDGQWNVYFHTFASDGRVRIGYASGTELTNLTVRSGAMLDVDASGIEGGSVGARSNVVKAGGYYYMAYEVCSPMTQFGDAQWGTNLARATSPDGPWEKLDDTLLTRGKTGFGQDGPELLSKDGKVYLYVREGGNRTQMMELSGLSHWGGTTMAHEEQSTPPDQDWG